MAVTAFAKERAVAVFTKKRYEEKNYGGLRNV